jgi:leucyl-tRNA synthetase
MGFKKSIYFESWPVYDEAMIKEETMTIVVQVNGKVRGRFDFAADKAEKDMEAVFLGDEKVKQYIKDGVKKIIWVPKKLANIIV